MTSRRFWRATGEHVVRVYSATLAGLLTSDGTGLLETAWVPRLSVAGMAAFIAFLGSLASSRVGDPESPTLTRT